MFVALDVFCYNLIPAQPWGGATCIVPYKIVQTVNKVVWIVFFIITTLVILPWKHSTIFCSLWHHYDAVLFPLCLLSSFSFPSVLAETVHPKNVILFLLLTRIKLFETFEIVITWKKVLLYLPLWVSLSRRAEILRKGPSHVQSSSRLSTLIRVPRNVYDLSDSKHIVDEWKLSRQLRRS